MIEFAAWMIIVSTCFMIFWIDFILNHQGKRRNMKVRDWCYQHVPVEEQDRGANDEGYYYHYCGSCDTRTEHETGGCCVCGSNSDPGYWD